MPSLTVILLLIIAECLETASNNEPDKRLSAFINGDFIIGALYPIHHQPSSTKRLISSQGIKCGEIRELYGIQRVEVTFQTLEKINNDPNLLPNMTLGVEIRDDCWYAPVALQQSIELIRDAITPVTSDPASCMNQKLNVTSSGERKGPLIGVVGPGSSSVALQVQNLLQLFHLTQVGYSTTSRDLSDKSRFNYFLRVVPSDYYQAQVMLDIVRHYGWTYVSAVNTDENYGQSGIQAFRELAEEADVCIAREDSVLSNAPDATFDKVILNLKQDPNAIVVVCFCEGLTVRGLLKATRRLNMTNHFLFIGSDGWADRSDVTGGYEKEAWGGISVRIHSPYVKSFDEYYWALTPNLNLRNPWFKEFWESRFACSLQTPSKQDLLTGANLTHRDLTVNNSSQLKLCSGHESLFDKYRQDSKLSFVIKAIYSLAHALHDMQQDICGHDAVGTCDKLFPFNGSLFKNYLMNVSFEYEEETLEFDDKGDPPGRYDIMNYQLQQNGTFDYVQVGSWNNRTLLWLQPLQFSRLESFVKSVCSEECPKGHYKNVQQGGKDKRCCWVCVPCPAGEILQKNSESCKRCPLGFTPDELKIVCLRLPIEFVQWFDTQAIVAMAFASLGFTTTASAFIIFIKFNNTPVVKSSTKELCYIILAGMCLSHASVFVIITRPTVISCALVRILPGLSFAMIYAALLTKTNRIARILAGSKKKFPTKKPLFMSAFAQVVITFILISIQAGISGGMLYYQNPNITHNYQAKRTILECDSTPEAILVPLAYDFFLIIMCTLYAVKTRNVPENFNEAKFIGFAMYTTCVIWIAFVPIYFGSDSKIITLCICVTLSAMVTWVFMFVPKMYIVIFRPEKNNRSFFTTNKTIRCHIGSRVASAITEKSSTSSWRDSSYGDESGRHNEYAPQKRTLSCQTGSELFQVLLNPKTLLEACSPPLHESVLGFPKITEKDCCESDGCYMKKITILLPNAPIKYE